MLCPAADDALWSCNARAADYKGTSGNAADSGGSRSSSEEEDEQLEASDMSEDESDSPAVKKRTPKPPAKRKVGICSVFERDVCPGVVCPGYMSETLCMQILVVGAT